MADIYVNVTDSDVLGNIPLHNEAGHNNPWECDTYQHAVQHTVVGDCTDIKWSIFDTPPNDLKINSSGVICGKVLPLTIEFQPILTKDMFYTKEPIKKTGSNYYKTGRFKNAFFIFNFTLRVDWTAVNSDPANPKTTLQGTSEVTVPPGGSKPGWVEFPVSIKVIKNHDINNLIFAYTYLKQGYILAIANQKYAFHPTTIEVDKYEYRAIKGKLPEGDPPYTIEIKGFKDFIKDHPGPFSNCLVELTGSYE